MSAAQGRGGAPVVDVHAHLVPFDAAAAGEYTGVRVIDKRLEIDGHALTLDPLYQPELLVEWMDANGIDTALVSAPPPAYRQQLDETQAARWTAYINDGLADVVADFPDHLKALAHLPMEHPAVAAREAAERYGDTYAGFSLPAGGPPTLTYSDPALRPVWVALHDHSSFAFLHPGSCADGRLSAFYTHNLLGNPYETAVAVAHLVFGGVLEDFPAIRFCLAHCGGVVPAVAGRWQQGYDAARPGIDTRRKAPLDLLKNVCVDCVAHDHGLMHLAEQVFGADRILLGSDWPFPMGLKSPRDWLSGLSEQQQRAILSGNYAALMADAETADA